MKLLRFPEQIFFRLDALNHLSSLAGGQALASLRAATIAEALSLWVQCTCIKALKNRLFLLLSIISLKMLHTMDSH